jgi:hypothetical protein
MCTHVQFRRIDYIILKLGGSWIRPIRRGSGDGLSSHIGSRAIRS